MAHWKSKVKRKLRKMSSTAGSTKGENCHASALDKTMARSSRSYREDEYEQYIDKKEKIRNYKYTPGN